MVVDDSSNDKVVLLFRGKGNQLIVSHNGKVEKGSWECIGNNSILIDKIEDSFLYKYGFVDDDILALKVDGKEEFVLLVNEDKFNHINSLESVVSFLQQNYVDYDPEKTSLPSLEQTNQSRNSAKQRAQSQSDVQLAEERIHLTARELLRYYPLEDSIGENEVIIMHKFTRKMGKYPIADFIDANNDSWKEDLLRDYYILKIHIP